MACDAPTSRLQNPNAPRKPAKRALNEIRSAFASSQQIQADPSLLKSQSSILVRDPASATSLDAKTLPPLGKRPRNQSPDSPLKNIEGDVLVGAAEPVAPGPARPHKTFAEMTDQEREEAHDAVLRYYYYTEQGIGAQHVAPFREEWWLNALDMTPR